MSYLIGMVSKLDEEISKSILLKHAYMFEVGRILLATAKKTDQYYTVSILESDVNSAVLSNPNIVVDKQDIGPCVSALVTEDYLKLHSPDQKKTMYLNVTTKGWFAISSGYFAQQYAAHQRDLLQAQLATSAINTNKWLRITSIIGMIIAAITGTFIAFQFFKNDVSGMQQINTQLEQTGKLLDSMRLSQKSIDSSFRTAIKDSFYR